MRPQIIIPPRVTKSDTFLPTKMQKWCTLPQNMIPHMVLKSYISLPTTKYSVCEDVHCQVGEPNQNLVT